MHRTRAPHWISELGPFPERRPLNLRMHYAGVTRDVSSVDHIVRNTPFGGLCTGSVCVVEPRLPDLDELGFACLCFPIQA